MELVPFNLKDRQFRDRPSMSERLVMGMPEYPAHQKGNIDALPLQIQPAIAQYQYILLYKHVCQLSKYDFICIQNTRRQSQNTINECVEIRVSDTASGAAMIPFWNALLQNR